MPDQACTKRYHFTVKSAHNNSPIITGTTHGVENRKLTYSSIPAGTYSIDDFNTRIKEFVLQQGQDWGRPQIKDLKLVIPRDYIFWADNTTFIALGISGKYLKKIARVRSTLPTGSYKASFDTLPPPRSLSLRCQQIVKVKNELDRQPSSLLARINVSNYKATFFPTHLVFLELNIDQPHIDFKIPDENNKEVFLRTFYILLLNKESAYITMKLKFIKIKTLQDHKNRKHID